MDVKHIASISIIVCFYWITSWSAIFINKYTLTYLNERIVIPYLITSIQFLVSALLLLALLMGNAYFKCTKDSSCIFSLQSFKKYVPLSVVFCLTITMGNMCLKHIEIPFYQVSRSIGIPMIPLVHYVLFKETCSFSTLLSCSILLFGYITGIEGEIRFSLVGTLFGLGASITNTFYTIYLKQLLQEKESSIWVISFYANLTSSILVCGISIWMGEVSTIRNQYESIPYPFYFWVMASGGAGMLVGFASYIQLQHVSSLSHNISGVVKNCLQTLISIMAFQSPLSRKGAYGLLLVCCGSLLYTMERVKISDKPYHQIMQDSRSMEREV